MIHDRPGSEDRIQSTEYIKNCETKMTNCQNKINIKVLEVSK